MITVHRVGRSSGRSLFPVLLVLLLLSAVALYIGLDRGLEAVGDTPLRLIVDGEEIVDGLRLGTLSGGEKLMAVLVLLAVGLALALLLPMLVLFVLAVVAFALMLGLGLPMLVVAAVLLCIASPVLLLVLMFAWMLKKAARPRPSATIAR